MTSNPQLVTPFISVAISIILQMIHMTLFLFQLGLGPTAVGGVFLVMALAFTLLAPFVGTLVDKKVVVYHQAFILYRILGIELGNLEFALCTESPPLNESEALQARMTSFINMSHCCVHQCVNDSRYSDELAIHAFPKDKPLRKLI